MKESKQNNNLNTFHEKLEEEDKKKFNNMLERIIS